MFTDVSAYFYFFVCLTSNKLYWIEDQLADVSTRFYTSASWSVGELVRRRVDWLPFKSTLCKLTGQFNCDVIS